MPDTNILHYVHLNKNDVSHVDMNTSHVDIKKTHVIIIILCLGDMMSDSVVIEVNFPLSKTKIFYKILQEPSIGGEDTGLTREQAK